MPSLQQLQEFVSAFKNIGDEVERLAEAELAYDETPLPDTDPPSPFPAGLSGEEADGGAEPSGGEPDAGEPEADEFPLDDLLGDMPGLGNMPADDILGSMGDLTGITDLNENPSETFGLPGDLSGEEGPDTGELPEDLLSGFSEDGTDGFAGDESASGAEDASFDLGELPGGFGEEPGGEDLGGEAGEEGFGDLGGEEGFGDLGRETGEAGFGDLGGEEGFGDLGGETGEAGFGDLGGEEGFGDLGGETGEAGFGDLGGEEGFGDLGGETGEEGFGDLGGEEGFGETETEASGAAEGDSFDNFTPGEESWTPESKDEDSGSAEEFGSEFSLEGFDDLDKGKPAAKKTVSLSETPEEVEEINLKEDEFQRLQDTLSSYPLNLRIACEQIIAEEAVDPALMANLIKLLARGAPAKETAKIAGKILARTIAIPRGFAKQTGAELEEEQASFGYIFVKKFIPVLRIFIFFALVLVSAGYLVWRFIVTPLRADGIYKEGYECIFEGDYNRSNNLFLRAFELHPVKNWFYRYAEAFRDVRHYQFAERKYDELLRVYPRDKKGALDYAYMETRYRKNFEKADSILRIHILDYDVNDREGLIALADNNLEWGAERPERYEEARAAYARLIARYGRQDPFLEGMLKYFIRTDQLSEVLPLQSHFMANPKKRKLSVSALAELGGYLLDKRFADVRGVPDEYIDKIGGIKDVLLRALKEDPAFPESYYHLARYYNKYGSPGEERSVLESAIKVFDSAPEENAKRAAYRAGAHRLYGEVLLRAGEFFPAANQFARGIRLYEDARARGVLAPHPEFGMLYADMGDITFYGQDGNMEEALRFYRSAEANDWSPPEMQYRMGAAHYELQQWEDALERFFTIASSVSNNRRLLYALGNTSYLRGDYFAAQGYYNRLMDLLEADRVRFPAVAPGSRPEEQDFAERIMVADNNLGVTLEALTRITGNTAYRSRALGLFSESIRAWDVLTRDPGNMARMRPIRDLYGPGVNLAYLNAQNILHAAPNYEQQIFMRIDRDMPEPSDWELLIPRDYRLSENLYNIPAQAAGF